MADQDPEAALGLPVRRGDELASPAQEMFSINDISSLMGISRDEIERAIYAGELNAVRADKAIVGIKRADVLAWLDQRGPGI